MVLSGLFHQVGDIFTKGLVTFMCPISPSSGRQHQVGFPLDGGALEAYDVFVTFALLALIDEMSVNPNGYPTTE